MRHCADKVCVCVCHALCLDEFGSLWKNSFIFAFNFHRGSVVNIQ